MGSPVGRIVGGAVAAVEIRVKSSMLLQHIRKRADDTLMNSIGFFTQACVFLYQGKWTAFESSLRGYNNFDKLDHCLEENFLGHGRL